MSLIIGIDISEQNTDFSAATISKVENGIEKIIDTKASNDSDEIKEFVKKYEPEYFTFKYKFQKLKEQRIAELKKLLDDGNLLFPINNSNLIEELKSL